NIDNRIENNNKNENKNEIEYEFENEIINKKTTSNIDEAIAKKVDKTLQMLSNYRKTMAFKSVAELMKNIVADFSYDAYLTSVGGSMAVGLMSFIASVAEAKYISLKKFLNEYAEVDAKESGVKYGGNRVKISTFHGFKGLEMPVVFVSDIASPFNTKSTAGDVLADGNGFIGISFFDLNKKTKSKTLSLLATKMRIDERESKEEMRLFYVALTRAKQYMYVTASLSSEKRMRSFASIPKIDLPSCNLDFVSNAVLEGNLDVCTFSHLGSDSASQSATANKNIPLLSVGGNQHLQQVIAESQKFVYPFAEATSLARKYSVSALDRVENETVRIFEEAANIGTLYHRVMEHIDFNAESLEAVSLELDNMVASG
ncbi:MAG: 3'-5' exonuclease, partial [Clostridia bacterium]